MPVKYSRLDNISKRAIYWNPPFISTLPFSISISRELASVRAKGLEPGNRARTTFIRMRNKSERKRLSPTVYRTVNTF